MSFLKVARGMAGADELLYLNQPIEDEAKDLIGMTAYVDNVEAAISAGAQMIGITSDFGGGKSTLINMLEKRRGWLDRWHYRFCRINLWCQMEQAGETLCVIDLHKTFLYQLTAQIRPKKGSYVSKRLSKNYGLLKICTSGGMATFLTGLLLVLIVAGLTIKTFQTQTGGLFPTLKAHLTGISLGYTIMHPQNRASALSVPLSNLR